MKKDHNLEHPAPIANPTNNEESQAFSLIPELQKEVTADLTEGKEFGDNPIYLFLRGENDRLKTLLKDIISTCKGYEDGDQYHGELNIKIEEAKAILNQINKQP